MCGQMIFNKNYLLRQLRDIASQRFLSFPFASTWWCCTDNTVTWEESLLDKNLLTSGWAGAHPVSISMTQPLTWTEFI